MTIFSIAILFLFSPCDDKNVHTYATTKALKNKTFTLKIHNIKEAINIQVTSYSENKQQTKI